MFEGGRHIPLVVCKEPLPHPKAVFDTVCNIRTELGISSTAGRQVGVCGEWAEPAAGCRGTLFCLQTVNGIYLYIIISIPCCTHL